MSLKKYDKVSAYPPVMVRAFRALAMAEGFKLLSPQAQRCIARTEPWFYAEIKLALANSIYGKFGGGREVKRG